MTRSYWDYPVVTFEPPPLPEIAAVDPKLRAVYAEALEMVLGPSRPLRRSMGELLDAVEWDWPERVPLVKRADQWIGWWKG